MDRVVTSVIRTNANGTTSDDDNILRGLEPLLPLRNELTDFRVVFWVVDRTGPLGPSRQHEDCVSAGDKSRLEKTVSDYY